MFTIGEMVRCVASNAVGLKRGKYYTVHSIRDGWVVVVDDFGHASSFSQDRFRPVDKEILEDEDYQSGSMLVSFYSDSQQSPTAGVGPEYIGDRQVILLVDDNVRLRAATAQQLRQLNYIVEEAGNANEALAILGFDCTIELLFSDIVMPGGMNGFDLARASQTLRPDVKILLTTGFTLSHHGKAAAENLGWPLIGKPYRIRELARYLAGLLKAPDAPSVSGHQITGG